MYLYFNWTIALLLGGFFLGSGVFLLLLPKRDMNNGVIFQALLGLITAWWAGVNAAELMTSDYDLKILFFQSCLSVIQPPPRTDIASGAEPDK